MIHFPKRSRHTLGQKIDILFLEVIESVFYAMISGGSEKSTCLKKAAKRLDLLKFLLHIAWEIRALDNKKYAIFSEDLDEIGRMLGGWLRKTLKETPPHLFGGERR